MTDNCIMFLESDDYFDSDLEEEVREAYEGDIDALVEWAASYCDIYGDDGKPPKELKDELLRIVKKLTGKP